MQIQSATKYFGVTALFLALIALGGFSSTPQEPTGKVAPPAKCGWGTARCSNAQSAAASLVPGIVFSSTAHGHLPTYATSDGKIVWDFDTAAQPYDAVNGKQAKGGTIDVGGAVIVNGMLYINSGYGRILGMGGNALLAFSVDGK